MSNENETGGVEYRIGWGAWSSVTFRGFTEWESWEDDGDPEEVLSAPEGRGPTNLPQGLNIFLNAAGIDWWVETRPSEGA